MDVDIGLNNLDVAMGIENKVVYDVVDVVENRCRPKQALIQDDFYPTLYTMPSCHGYDKSSITGINIRNLTERLSQSFDYILLDCPAGIELGFHRAVSAADEAIVVTTPHISSIRDADKVINLLNTYELIGVSVIVNRVRGDLIAGGEMLTIESIAGLLKKKIIGVIPENDSIVYNTAIGRTLYGSACIKECFSLIADNIHSGGSRLYDPARSYKGLFGAIKRSIKKRV
jgi:septum site-determining protein MinD